VENKEK